MMTQQMKQRNQQRLVVILDTVLGEVKDDDAITSFYILIPEKDNHHVLSVLYDGVMIYELINNVEPNFINLRSISRPDVINPMPLCKKRHCRKYMQLVMLSLKSLGIELNEYTVDAWFDHELVATKMIDIINQLADRNITENVTNPSKLPKLMRLAKNNEIETKEIASLMVNKISQEIKELKYFNWKIVDISPTYNIAFTTSIRTKIISSVTILSIDIVSNLLILFTLHNIIIAESNYFIETHNSSVVNGMKRLIDNSKVKNNNTRSKDYLHFNQIKNINKFSRNTNEFNYSLNLKRSYLHQNVYYNSPVLNLIQSEFTIIHDTIDYDTNQIAHNVTNGNDITRMRKRFSISNVIIDNVLIVIESFECISNKNHGALISILICCYCNT